MNSDNSSTIRTRSTSLYAVVFLAGAIIIGRLFFLQVIQYDYYADQALAEHESKFSVPASRGSIFALDGDAQTPLVLNEVLPTVYVDPLGIDDEDNESLAATLSDVLSINKETVLERLEQNETRYQVIKKQISHDQAKEIKELDLNGVGLADQSYRVYPQNGLAGQTLGFLNGDGKGQYGVEEFLDEELSGTDGRFEAVTDVYGIPLSTSQDNITDQPVDGQDTTLTLDVNIQRYVEQALEDGVKSSKGKSGSAIVIDPNTGAVKAMANYPTYNPEKFGEVEDFSVFQNNVVSSPYETGSGVKIFTMSAALNEGAVTKNTSYYDPGYVTIGDRRIENAGTSGGVDRTMLQVIQNSVNTGVVYALQQLGDGEINDEAKNTLYDYFTTKYGFGSQTGIAQANEGAGVLFAPDTEQGNAVRYANMTFGQGMTVTMLQMAAAASAAVNGGDYYQPYLVHSTSVEGETTVNDPQVIRENVITDQTSETLREMMQAVVQNGGGFTAQRKGYEVGGKTGTAQVLDENGEYSDTREIGSFVGFGGGSEVEYVIMTRVDEPQIAGYAGSVAAAPIFADISNFLIDYYQIPPK